MQLLKHTRYWMAGVVLLLMAACDKDYYRYEKYIANGPIVYPGRPDSVQVLAGKERVLLKWKVPSDLNITGYKVFWNFGVDSLSIPGRTNGSTDSVAIYINNLPQGAYSFAVYAYDKSGHRSVGTQAIGNVYGSIFASTIFNRPYTSVKKESAISKLSVAWVGLDAKSIGTEWSYTNIDGQAATLYSPLGDSTIITGINTTSPISYRSLFLPESNAIDTFYTELKSL